jgi:hypothetical protein
MVKNEKVYELRIEEDDIISGIDSISLVSEPAIEINWVAFSKEKQEDFQIPDGEDDKYVELLMTKGHPEQDLIDEGYSVHSVEYIGKEGFATKPNAESEWDTEEYQIRYKYALSPNIKESSIISTTRDFCKHLVNKNYVWRIEEMDSLTNDFGSPAIVWRGGYNCRHVWAKIRYKKDATIINKASVNKGKAIGDVPGPMETDIIGYQQPSTVTEKTINNPSPSTIKNLGLAKEAFAGLKVSIDYDDTLSTQSGKDLARRLINEGKDVYVVTRRQQSQLGPVYRIADEIGIPHSKIHATNGRLKWETIKRLGIQKHIDNNQDELDAIKKNAPLIQIQKFQIDCPKATQDVETNLKNRQKAIVVAKYGPLNPNEPNEDYWKAKAKMFGGDVESAKKARCGNCAFFVQTQKMLDCIASGINDVNEWDTIDAGDLGYCEAFDFKCAASRTCDAWVVGGPITDEDMGYDVGAIGGYVDPGVSGNTIPKSLVKPSMFESYSDYPDSVKNNAKAVLKYAEENGWGSCGTDVGKQRANQLANGEPISEDTIRRMYSYLSRHEVDLDSSKGYGDGCGKLMYDAWGGKSALSWSEAKIKAIEKEKMSKQEFATDEEKRVVLGPAMVPEMRIFRRDALGNPYHVFFSAETIKMIAEKYMRNKYIDNNDTEHNGQAASDVYVIESWIKEDDNDKSAKYGFGELPVGTWFVAMKVRNAKVWQEIKDKKLNGFSVSGYFEEVAAFCREEMFLQQVIEILNNVQD